jgi:hypothetical protein
VSTDTPPGPVEAIALSNTILLGEVVEELVRSKTISATALHARFAFYEGHAKENNPNGLQAVACLIKAIERKEVRETARWVAWLRRAPR